MTPYDRRLNPYINRMAQNKQIRDLAASTIDSYTLHVDKFCGESQSAQVFPKSKPAPALRLEFAKTCKLLFGSIARSTTHLISLFHIVAALGCQALQVVEAKDGNGFVWCNEGSIH